MPPSKLSVLLLVVCVILAGCSGFGQPGDDGTSPPTSPPTETESPMPPTKNSGCYVLYPDHDLSIENQRLTYPVGPMTVSILVERIDHVTNESEVVLKRNVTVQYRGQAEIQDVPGWDDRLLIEDQLMMTVRDDNGTIAQTDLDDLGGNRIIITITDAGVEIGSVDVLQSTRTCTPA